jgi:adenylate cyclase
LLHNDDKSKPDCGMPPHACKVPRAPMPAPADTLARRRDSRLRRAFARERQTGLRLATMVRVATFALIAVWLGVTVRELAVLYYVALCVLFIALGAAQLAARPDLLWPKYAFAVVDATLLTIALVVPNPFWDTVPPPGMMLRGEYFLYFFLFLAHTVLSLSPLFVLWTGLVCAASWGLGVAWIANRPGVRTMHLEDMLRLPFSERIAANLEPNTVILPHIYQEIVLLLLVSAVLAVAVRRSQSLLRRQAAAERERGNLARYFSPNVVDELAQLDNPIGADRRQHAAVLFADIVGFSAFAERERPEAVIALLREHYERLAAVVFTHGGTLDKYIGDALMATFGAPRPGHDDASRALAAGKAMIASLSEWNTARRAGALEPVGMGVGIDYGPVVLGNIGSERRLEFTVIGDTVNVAERLESLTRELGVDLVVSGRLVEAVRREGGDALLEGLVEGAPAALRGRDEKVPVWVMGRKEAPVRLVSGSRESG